MQLVLVLHNLIRWAVLLFGLWTFFNAIFGAISKRNYTVTDNRSNFLFMLSCDIQLLLGLILYFANSWFDRLKDLGNNMKDTSNRFYIGTCIIYDNCVDTGACWQGVCKKSYNIFCQI